MTLSEITNPVLTTEMFAEKMDRQNNLLLAMLRQTAPPDADWPLLEKYANDGVFGELFSWGDQFMDTWRNTVDSKEYTYPWRLNHIGAYELADGEILNNRPCLQLHYAHLHGVQFSHQRAFLACPEGLSAGTYYFTIESGWGSNVTAGDVVCFTLTQDVPAGGRVAGCYGAPDQSKSNWRVYSYGADGITLIETVTPTFTASGTDLGVQKHNQRSGSLNSTQEMAYGWNRWKTSAVRQYLNSSAGVGNWWKPQDEWDIAPDQLKTLPGFLSGCSEAFINAIKPVKVKTYVNTVYDSTQQAEDYDITYDKVFLPSLEELYINPQKAGEGNVHEYWRRRSGRTSPLPWYQGTPEYVTYAVENHNSAQDVRLRSANRNYAGYAWLVGSSGYVYHYGGASIAYRFSPLVVL